MIPSRVGELPEDQDGETIMSLPEMMFAEGEEPVGVRVLTYQSSRIINTILNALDEEEVQFIRQSSFGKLVEIADKPAFSGRFARFLLSRQLKVEKKHEAWFRFAGQPIRFSLREFAIVTGLPCGEFPKKQKVKKKKNINDKPYWPELFGSVEDMRVSRAIKMLHKKTVTDKDIRIKLACLAIVSSVLLSTNLKMKMLKEHAELLGDMEEFFAFPWGRIAFDMLMTSIKKKDEISLSQNSIALKGFALALQLVIVEAVPSLTEVVQESCSSSESDSDEDDVDGVGSKTKKKTLSPAHAREVLVRSILPQDPARPVDESVLVWADEVVDVKVAYMLSCINANQVFTKDMFRGGVTKADVERMRELAKAGGRKKTLPTQGKESPVVMNDERRITSIVNAIMRPELNRIDGDIATVVASVKEVSGCSLAIEAKVIATVERMLDSFKTEIMSGRRRLNTQSSFESPISTGGPDGVGDEEVLPNTTAAAPAGNDEIIENVIENLSHYSTPPGVDNDWPVSLIFDVLSIRNPCSEGIVEESNENHPCRSAHSQTHEHPDPIIPSFSLGLTQEFHQTRELGDDVMGENEEHLVEKDNGDDTRETEENLLCRKSKRIRTVPPQLLTDYQCEAAIINRAREVPIMGNGHYGLSDVHDKYKRLQILLKKECVINVLGLSVSGKDITDIGGRTRLLPGRVVDIIMRVIAASVNRRLCEGSSRTPVFLDSRVQVLLSRNFTKFRKSKRESQYVFTQALVDTLQKSLNFNPAVSLFYMPVSIGRQHWVGICVDISTANVYVLDCNPQVIDDKALSKELAPITEMFPSLLKHCGLLVEYGNNAFVVERVKGVVKNPNPSDAAITSCLLMQTHALSGPETCRSITPSLIPDEAQTAAVMVYEFHKKI
ncbi:unnamed protein product [Brassica rapa subsp. trilocularis]